MKTLSLLTLIGLAQWFFGNFYEAIVLAPNMLVNSFEKLQRWHEYFTLTNQIYYYVPFTQASTVMVWWLYWKSRDKRVKRDLAVASLFGLLALLLTVFIVTSLNLKLFFGNLDPYRDTLYAMALRWNIFNAIRVVLVGIALGYSFSAYNKINRLAERVELKNIPQ